MKISLSPARMDEQLALSVEGKVLTLNGETYDFESLQEGESLENVSKWLQKVSLVNGQLEVILLLPLGPNAPWSSRFPDPLLVFIDGPVELPSYSVVE